MISRRAMRIWGRNDFEGYISGTKCLERNLKTASERLITGLSNGINFIRINKPLSEISLQT